MNKARRRLQKQRRKARGRILHLVFHCGFPSKVEFISATLSPATPQELLWWMWGTEGWLPARCLLHPMGYRVAL